jgi:hypothetical protein
MAVTLQAILRASFAAYAETHKAPRLESGTGRAAVPPGCPGRPRAMLSAGPWHGGLVEFLSPSRRSALWSPPD